MKEKTYKPVVLVILDGMGIDPGTEGNAVKLAKMPNWNKYLASYPATSIQAAGISVGLFWGENGNSEVGHLNLGAGMIIYQNLPRITLAIQDKTFFSNENLLAACNHVKKNNSTLHLLGLVSAGGIHSHIDHLFALLQMAKENKVKNVIIHAITDGRDTPRNAAGKYIGELEAKLRKMRLGKIATVSGRFFTMDRDNRWDRIEKAYNAIVNGVGAETTTAAAAVADSYSADTYDESIVPTVITKNGRPIAKINDNDAVVFFNFRADRARQITKAFVLDKFDKFSRPHKLQNLFFATMTQYEEGLPVKVAFPSTKIVQPLAKAVSENGMRQLHIAETEKYAHVTYFFDGGKEKPFPGERQIVIPSPQVKSYDQVPEMSAQEVTDSLCREILTGKYGFVVVNYANPDMVGHTGNLQATVKALEFIDKKIKDLIETILSVNGVALITADHGNCEQMVETKTQEIIKEHSTNPVPLVMIGNDFKLKQPKTEAEISQEQLNPTGVLADVAPTVLDLLGLEKPQEMTGISLKNSLLNSLS
jgi:2,3-bisphosphoglycerate-independent phosphoglycerate mutase